MWFSQQPEYDAEQQEAIGQLTAEGDYKKWPQFKGSAPNNIIAGPDEVLWFTDRRNTGHIDIDGGLSHFPVHRLQVPERITLGPDKARWFTTYRRVGRIALWPVRGTNQLASIVPVPDGDFWLANLETDMIRRFAPPR
ncbi:hypothetical protein [Streptomyces sp. PSAA01]|uniref:virginiamycin B lyase family protein n=1 Tax=Streptomyces sp. PSAA01 TaxID=2912762 RepID=UPI001F27605C|nr:hypothetical protein [Streptomyces sp. PSAA01]MCG0284515.1 hypothetical protein [Streptomyces sp. PSAA01]